MKKISALILLVAFATAVIGQDTANNEIQTLFSDRQSMGFYGGFSLGYTQIDGRDALVSGGRAAIIFNHATAIGFAGYGFANGIDSYKWHSSEEERHSLAGGYGGIFVEPILGGLKPVHVAFPVLFGLGGITRLTEYREENWTCPGFNTTDSDLFLIIEPAVELEVNLTRFFRTAATLSYRYTSPIELADMDKDLLKGFHFGMTFKIGKF